MSSIPKNFNYKTYLLLNPDLIAANIITEKSAIKHYLEYGIRENRQYLKPIKNNLLNDTKNKNKTNNKFKNVTNNKIKIKTNNNYKEKKIKQIITKNDPFFLSIGAIFKNESHILKEWLDHHLRQGVEHFYLINNESTDNFAEILEPYIKNKQVDLFNFNGHGQQLKAYNSILTKRCKKETVWLAVIDLDEFLFSPNGFDIKDILRTYNKIGGLAAPWLMFGSNGFKKQPDSVIHSFTKRQSRDTQVLNNVKTICNMKKVKSLRAHMPTYTKPDIITVLSNNEMLISGMFADTQESKIPSYKLVINHYPIQSLEYYTNIKMTRGDVRYQSNNRDMTYFKNYDHNHLEDLTLSKLTEKQINESVNNSTN